MRWSRCRSTHEAAARSGTAALRGVPPLFGWPRSGARWLARNVGGERIQILATASEQGAAVVTIDADFHALLALSGAGQPSVIRLRVQGRGAADLVRLILSVVEVCEADLLAGAVVTADTNRARVRRLPLVP